MRDQIPGTVGILTFNSAGTLRRALESVHEFNDIVICDGGSTDDTLNIAREFGAHIISQDKKYLNEKGAILDFSGVRNQLLSVAKYEWFLYIDSDEYLSAQVKDEIKNIITSPAPFTSETPLAYWLPRKTVIGGEIIECATAYPNYQMRFFHKSGVIGFIKQVHERIALKEGVRIAKLKFPEYIPLDIAPEKMREKQLYYLKIEVDRHKDDTFFMWLTGPVKGALRSSLSYLVRHVRILVFCRGKRMPFWVEWMHHWYNWKLITLTGEKFFTFGKR